MNYWYQLTSLDKILVTWLDQMLVTPLAFPRSLRFDPHSVWASTGMWGSSCLTAFQSVAGTAISCPTSWSHEWLTPPPMPGSFCLTVPYERNSLLPDACRSQLQRVLWLGWSPSPSSKSLFQQSPLTEVQIGFYFPVNSGEGISQECGNTEGLWQRGSQCHPRWEGQDRWGRLRVCFAVEGPTQCGRTTVWQAGRREQTPPPLSCPPISWWCV